MAATPPVGSGLARVLVRFATSREFWNDTNWAATGWSTFCQLRLLIQRASNFDSDRSNCTEAREGSSEKTRMASVPPTPPPPTPPNWLGVSILNPKLFGLW